MKLFDNDSAQDEDMDLQGQLDHPDSQQLQEDFGGDNDASEGATASSSTGDGFHEQIGQDDAAAAMGDSDPMLAMDDVDVPDLPDDEAAESATDYGTDQPG